MNDEMDQANIFERCKRLVSWRAWSEAREEDMSHPISNQKFLAADCLQSKGADECGRVVRGSRGWPLGREKDTRGLIGVLAIQMRDFFHKDWGEILKNEVSIDWISFTVKCTSQEDFKLNKIMELQRKLFLDFVEIPTQ